MWTQLFFAFVTIMILIISLMCIDGYRMELALEKDRYKSIETFIHKKSLDLLCVCDYQTDVNGHQSVFIWKEDMQWHFIGVSHVDDDFVKLNNES